MNSCDVLDADESVLDGEGGEMSNTRESIVYETLYDCCICNQSTPSTEQRPIGLVTLLQSTNGKSQTDRTGHTSAVC